MYSEIISRNGMLLGAVSESVKTLALCRLAVSENGLALQFVPDKLKLPEVVTIAIAQSVGAIRFAPPRPPLDLSNFRYEPTETEAAFIRQLETV